jgi:hypothetical protein
MPFSVAFTRGLMALVAVAPLALAFEAEAEEACGDRSCPTGFRCETYPTACPDIDCADDSGSCPACEPGTEELCVPATCRSNADCAADMLCVTEERTRCDDSAAADCGDAREGEKPDCAPAPEANCTTERVSQCVPRWQLPCTSAADCGAGFTCDQRESCTCSGSSGSGGGGDPGTPTPADAEERAATPAPDDCSCVPSGEFGCAVIETACTSDESCPAGWTCEENREGVCWSGPEGSGCEPAEPAKLCAPPYSNLGGGRGVNHDDSESSGDGLGETEAPTTAGGDKGETSDGAEVITTDRGCATAALPRSRGAAALWLALGLGAVFISRRRR